MCMICVLINSEEENRSIKFNCFNLANFMTLTQ